MPLRRYWMMCSQNLMIWRLFWPAKFFIPNSDWGFDEPAELSLKLQPGILKRVNEMHLRSQPTAAVAIHPRLGQLHQCNKCGKSFLRRHQLTCHKILHKYSRFRCMPSNCSKATLYGNRHISSDCKPIQADQHRKTVNKEIYLWKNIWHYTGINSTVNPFSVLKKSDGNLIWKKVKRHINVTSVLELSNKNPI